MLDSTRSPAARALASHPLPPSSQSIDPIQITHHHQRITPEKTSRPLSGKQITTGRSRYQNMPASTIWEVGALPSGIHRSLAVGVVADRLVC